MRIVGVGCGPGMLTEEAIRAIGSASAIYGSERALEIARPHILPGCTVRTIDDFRALNGLPEDAVVLSTGDPMLAGLGYLSGEIIPGISSLQIAAARLRVPLARITPVVAHGTGHTRGVEQTLLELRQGKIVFLLADPKFDAPALFETLSGITGEIRIAVCENLGYPDERIAAGTPAAPPAIRHRLYSLMIGVF